MNVQQVLLPIGLFSSPSAALSRSWSRSQSRICHRYGMLQRVPDEDKTATAALTELVAASGPLCLYVRSAGPCCVRL